MEEVKLEAGDGEDNIWEGRIEATQVAGCSMTYIGLLGWLGRQPGILGNLCTSVYYGTWGIGFVSVDNIGPQSNLIASSST